MGSPRHEVFVGWRLWRLRPQGLHSWAATCYWNPGPNSAACLSTNPCPSPPGNGCRCGFWGLFSPMRCLEHARIDSRERLTVLGLVRGWGEVALHGEEGFRAANAAVVALFTDWIWDARAEPATPLGRWWRQVFPGGGGPFSRPCTPPDPNRQSLLADLATTYGVPLLPLQDALRSGFLGEVGVDVCRREELRCLLARQASSGGGSTHQGSGHHGVSDAA